MKDVLLVKGRIAASNVSEYPFGYSETLVGDAPSPGLAAHASSRTRLTAWLCRSLRSLIPALRAGKGQGETPTPVARSGQKKNTVPVIWHGVFLWSAFLFFLFFLLRQNTENPVNILLCGLVVNHLFSCDLVFFIAFFFLRQQRGIFL